MMTSSFANNAKPILGLRILVLLLSSILTVLLIWILADFANTAVIKNYLSFIRAGLSGFLVPASGHLLFILSLFTFRSKDSFILKQLLAYSLAYTLTFWLGSFELLTPNTFFVHSLTLISIIYIAAENIIVKKLNEMRLVVIALFGLIHGMYMSCNFLEMGIHPHLYAITVLLYNVGTELALILLTIPLYLIMMKLLVKTGYKKMFYKIISTILIFTISYWLINLVFN